MLEFATDWEEMPVFSLGFIGTIASIIAGGAVATVTVVGLVNNTVESHPSNPGSVSSQSSSTITYGTR
jgi:hypothetical protein